LTYIVSLMQIMLTHTEENYLKELLHLSLDASGNGETGTNALAVRLGVKPATVTDMLKKLKEKKLISYERYGKISLSAEGKMRAILILRKHRLWETFLYEKLEFSWDEVHAVAEQLEHIQSEKLVAHLDKFLGYPTLDPHGDIIPTAEGELAEASRRSLAEEIEGHSCMMVGLKDSSSEFLQYMDRIGLSLRTRIKVITRFAYDDSMEIEVSGRRIQVSPKVADNVVVVCKKCQQF